MASNYSIFSKGIDDVFKDISRNKIKKAKKVRYKIQSIVKSFKHTLYYTDFKLRGSEYRQLLSTRLNFTERYLLTLANHTKEYTNDFIRYTKIENDPTVFTLVVSVLLDFFVIACFFWFIFNSASLFGFFVSFLSTVLIAFALGRLIDYFGRIWLLVDPVNRSKRKSLEALSIIQDNSNLIIEKLESTSVDTILMDLNQSKLFENLPEKLNPLWLWADSLSVAPETVLVALEATAASLIDPGTTLLGRKKTNFKVGPTIFSAIVGEPGSKKSPILEVIAIEPLMEMQDKATKLYQEEYLKYEKELSEWENSKEQDKGPAPTPPIKRRYMTSDYTPEALRDLAEKNPKILRVFDELARESKGRNRYTGGKGNEAQQLLESYDVRLPGMRRRGKRYPSMRVNQCLVGGIQPGILSEIMSSNDPTGEFARYNVASLDNRSDQWDKDDDKIIDITGLLVGLYKGIDELPEQHFYLSKEASDFFVDVHNKLEDAARKESNPAIIFQYKKGSGKILRWALLYHIMNAVALDEKPSQEVPKRYIQIAQYRMNYQIDQVAIIARMDDTTSSRLSRVYQLALEKSDFTITQRDVKRRKLAKETDEAIAHFNKLVDMGYGEILKTPRAIKFVAKPL